MGIQKRTVSFAALLFATVVGAATCRPRPAGERTVDSPYRATSTVREVMQSVVASSAQGLWDAVGTISNAKGTRHIEPKTDEDWAAVRRHAVTLMESTNLLLIPGRHVAPAGAETRRVDEADPGAELPPVEIERRVNANWATWTVMAYALHDAAGNILKTVDTKDVAGLESSGSDLDGICENCHLAFWYPPTQPK